MPLTIYATQNSTGQWTLTDAEGHEAQDGYGYPDKATALAAATQLWPANSEWRGRRVRNGWRIDSDEPEPKRKHAAGTRPDTSLYLGDARRSWLTRQGGIQPTIQQLVDAAMRGNS